MTQAGPKSPATVFYRFILVFALVNTLLSSVFSQFSESVSVHKHTLPFRREAFLSQHCHDNGELCCPNTN